MELENYLISGAIRFCDRNFVGYFDIQYENMVHCELYFKFFQKQVDNYMA